MMPAHVPNDISGQPFSPAEKIRIERQGIVTLILSLKLAEVMPKMSVERFLGKFVKQINGKAEFKSHASRPALTSLTKQEEHRALLLSRAFHGHGNNTTVSLHK